MSQDPLVGIDLGTTHTLVAVLAADGPQVLPGARGEPLIPSAVAVDAQGHLLVGESALARIEADPGAGVRAFKREMGTPKAWQLGPHTLDATALSALVLREALAVAEHRLGRRPARAVITVPAYFQEPQRAATAEAGRLAGLKVERLINEPTAAAMAYGLHDAHRERRCCVVDLGGGTLDITLLDIFDGVIEVIGSSGDARLGGEDFTDALWRHALAAAGLADAPRGPAAMTLRAACEQAKRALAHQDLVSLVLPAPEPDRWRPAGALRLTRARALELWAPLLDRLSTCLEEALRAAGVAPEAVEELLLVGGASRNLGVEALARQHVPAARLSATDPDLAIARGAAVQAGLIDGHAAVDDIVVTDVLGHSLGIETSREGQDRFHHGYYLPVLHRNTTLPARRIERISTIHPRQRRLTLRVFQGEHRRVEHNLLLGEFHIDDLPVAEDGEGLQAVDVAFTQDLSGLLEVEATVVSSGESRRLLIEQRAGQLDPAARARALAAIEALKVHPRDLLPNRLLMEQAHEAHQRAEGMAREALDRAIFAFEDALERMEGGDIEASAASLRGLLKRLAGGP